MEQLFTKRLILRPLKQSDFELYNALYSNDTVMQYIGPVWSRARVEQEFSLYIAPWFDEEGQWLSYAINYNSQTVGVVGLKLVSKSDNRRELGYMLLPEFFKLGIAYEAAKAVVDYAFNILGTHKLIAVCDNRNQASKTILNKLGFDQEGLLKEQFKFNGEWIDDALYGLLEKHYFDG
ncbi:hypothetical protein C2869_15095 [Saccharobesus litoralis]|uniref:N-acetyltransferase domain-containing protein n=1 Tax=Saccharobesus litoralis TaxID=2172099 RepID=A0A2S0VU22_9ALTE|nr:GNAT family N-acetyltransferase [Saccharobesus litoralis]AWB67683.1 hypothetical protein C2869_15095 [Saccharobesus litoralis]